MLSYCASKTLKKLSTRDDVEKLEIAKLEHAYPRKSFSRNF